jgi:hypothetical protein
MPLGVCPLGLSAMAAGCPQQACSDDGDSLQGTLLAGILTAAKLRDELLFFIEHHRPSLILSSSPPQRSPGRGPPYWKSRVLRRQVLGDEDEGAGSPLGPSAQNETTLFPPHHQRSTSPFPSTTRNVNSKSR